MIERAAKKEKTRIKEKSRDNQAVDDLVVDFSASFHPSFR